MTLTTEIALLLLLILGNGLLSMAEIALVSARSARLESRAAAGDRGARVALELRAEPGRLLSTVQIGITLVGIVAGAFGGAAVAAHIRSLLADVPTLAPYAEPLSYVLVVAVITYFSLVIGELVPKHLALRHPEALAARLARPLRGLARLSVPAVALLDGSTRAIVKLFRLDQPPGPPVTDEELRHMLRIGREAGVFEAVEQEIVERVLRLSDARVGDLVTPRSRLVALDLDEPPRLSRQKAATAEQTIFPVYRGELDNIVGVVSVHELLAETPVEADLDLERCLREPLFLPETLPAFDAFERLRRARPRAALVFDEYGGIEGLLTLRDVLEAIVGDLPTASQPEPMIVRREDGSLLLDGMLSVGELTAVLELPEPSRGELEGFRTVGGLVMGTLRRVPREGDAFDWMGHRLEVVDMDGRRVDKVLATRSSEPEEGSPGSEGP